ATGTGRERRLTGVPGSSTAIRGARRPALSRTFSIGLVKVPLPGSRVSILGPGDERSQGPIIPPNGRPRSGADRRVGRGGVLRRRRGAPSRRDDARPAAAGEPVGSLGRRGAGAVDPAAGPGRLGSQ